VSSRDMFLFDVDHTCYFTVSCRICFVHKHAGILWERIGGWVY
jgi:hypothetical protein